MCDHSASDIELDYLYEDHALEVRDLRGGVLHHLPVPGKHHPDTPANRLQIAYLTSTHVTPELSIAL